MKIEHFFDKGLAQLSYAITSENEVALIDPARDPRKYYEYAQNNNLNIVAVIETHSHADFISSHAEISKNGAKIYISKYADATYPHTSLDEGESIKLGKVTLRVLNTPGHSPDSICIILQDHQGKDYAVFSGDTLFIGDVGRPDLRESNGNAIVKKEMFAKQMYHSLRDKLMKLPDDLLVFPAHGAGSLCGKSISQELSGTIGQQKRENYALKEMDEAEFVKTLLENQPAIPKYFSYNVELNLVGAPPLEDSIKAIRTLNTEYDIPPDDIIIDTRPPELFKSGHLKGAFNIPDGEKFETSLGSILAPEEKFYLIAANTQEVKNIVIKAAKIGYETNILATLAQEELRYVKEEILNIEAFTSNVNNYTIIDVREIGEIQAERLFKNSIHIPLAELRERKDEIPCGKPVVIHCAGGYRSAIGASILSALTSSKIYDLGENIKKFKY